jgi:hypothetical protein
VRGMAAVLSQRSRSRGRQSNGVIPPGVGSQPGPLLGHLAPGLPSSGQCITNHPSYDQPRGTAARNRVFSIEGIGILQAHGHVINYIASVAIDDSTLAACRPPYP